MTLALVTGGNRGIGFEVCKELAQAGLRVWLGSRDPRAGDGAAARLRAEGLDVVSRQLDVAEASSIAALKLDEPVQVLVNNAGVSLRGFDAQIAQRTLDINYFGALAVTDAVLPHMPRGGRIVMVSSGMGELSAFGPELRRRFLSADRRGVEALGREFVALVARGEHGGQGWPSNAYRVSKAAMNALVRSWAPELAKRGVIINAVCPGWVRTDMGGPGAPRSLEQGARGIVWAATLPDDGPRGGFFRDSQSLEW